jgi:stage IV sporulation protein B
MPLNVFAYSDYILAGGQNIGIELDSNGPIIVGTYNIGNSNPAKDANLKTGDKIVSINDTKVSSISDMLEVIGNITEDTSIKLGYVRGNNSDSTTLNLLKDDNGVLKTGLYVKDSINGVGTLTFIDPNSKIYGALGHEVIEKTTGQKLEIKDGKIYASTVTGITPSNDGNPGEKNARYDSSEVFGNVTENSTSGIFGTYTDTLPNGKLYKVASENDVKLGKASILTVTSGEKVKDYEINILKVNKDNDNTKNILFEVTDNELLKISGGIVQGMSGSPIIQDDKIIGAVTHVVVDDPTKGYGIFITNMLEEAEN